MDGRRDRREWRRPLHLQPELLEGGGTWSLNECEKGDPVPPVVDEVPTSLSTGVLRRSLVSVI